MTRVLVAEDEPALLASFAEMIEAMGHECLQARDGEEALQLAQRMHPDLVVTDFMMPGRSGIDVIHALRADPVLHEIPIVLMSAGRPREEHRQLASRYLQKPINVEEFENAVELFLTERTKPPVVATRVAAESREMSEIRVARDEMLSWVSHEIKTPLAAAMTAAQLGLRKAERGSEFERRFIMIKRQLSRMNELTASVLDAAQLQEGKLKLQLESVRLKPWILEIAGYWRDLYPEYNLPVEIECDLTIEVDKARLRQVLDNVISNAIKYSGGAKTVGISCGVDDGAARIAVTDSGHGIPSEELSNIFSRFHRVSGTAGRGHGLGLYVASALAKLHGGVLSVRSEVDRGSTFTLTLPRTAAPCTT